MSDVIEWKSAPKTKYASVVEATYKSLKINYIKERSPKPKENQPTLADGEIVAYINKLKDYDKLEGDKKIKCGDELTKIYDKFIDKLIADYRLIKETHKKSANGKGKIDESSIWYYGLTKDLMCRLIWFMDIVSNYVKIWRDLHAGVISCDDLMLASKDRKNASVTGRQEIAIELTAQELAVELIEQEWSKRADALRIKKK